MDNDSSFALSEVIRKLANLIRIGKIEEIQGAQVRVKIDRVITGWLPIVGQAGDTSTWIPLTKGEQVVVFSPYGESAQAFVLRGLYYNDFPVPNNDKEVSLTTNSDISCKSKNIGVLSCEKGVKISSGKSITINTEDVFVEFLEDSIKMTAGNATISISDSGITLSCGSSSIRLNDSNISLDSGSISTNPPVCMCGGM